MMRRLVSHASQCHCFTYVVIPFRPITSLELKLVHVRYQGQGDRNKIKISKINSIVHSIELIDLGSSRLSKLIPYVNCLYKSEITNNKEICDVDLTSLLHAVIAFFDSNSCYECLNFPPMSKKQWKTK